MTQYIQCAFGLDCMDRQLARLRRVEKLLIAAAHEVRLIDAEGHFDMPDAEHAVSLVGDELEALCAGKPDLAMAIKFMEQEIAEYEAGPELEPRREYAPVVL